MKKIFYFALIIFFNGSVLFSEPSCISEIMSRIDQYKNKTITLNLKLKHVDRIFDKIFFYDGDNIDIEFDIADKELKKSLHNDMLNLHEGMNYNVIFVVKGKGTLGELIAVLKGFTPVILDKIP